MFHHDNAMTDTENHVFINVNQAPKTSNLADDEYLYDDFGTHVLPDDLVMKVIFSKKEIRQDRLIKITFAKYVTIDNFVELIDDIGIEYQDYSFAMEGREYLQKKIEGALDRE